MKYNEWPTLDEMIDSGQRVVIFLDYGANKTQVDFILPEFDTVHLECTLSAYTSQPNQNLVQA